ncbi:MAG: chromate resistance protein [Ideonella sp.]|nr:chromate resistance protein [Ideonella sp.]
MDLEAEAAWLLLVVTLPTQGATARMRIWRALKARGCAALRDGAYLLPAGADRDEALQRLAAECEAEGGSAWVMAVQPRSEDEALAFQSLFDRAEDYAALAKSWQQANRTLASLALPELARLQRRLQREYEALRTIDFFPSEASVDAEVRWGDLNRRIDSVLSPGEPHETQGAVPRLDARQYQGRLWATRRRLWVDRVASAWLIRRFIDRKATFRWLAAPSDCPKKALGFDFDGAAFTHVGDRVTFETLLSSFGLDGDAGLQRLAALVHQLDVGGEPVPEAGGFEAILAGARERLPDDDALLAEMTPVLDSLYAHFERAAARARSSGP